MRTPIALAAVAGLLAAPVVIAAPAPAAAKVDARVLQRYIERGIKKQAKIKVKATCPKNVTWVKGKIIYCRVKTPSGSKYRVQVKLGTATTGKVYWKVIA